MTAKDDLVKESSQRKQKFEELQKTFKGYQYAI